MPALRTAVLITLLVPWVVAAEPAGQGAYERQCAPCHGADARGDGPDAALFLRRPRDLRDGVLARYSTEELTRMIRDGRPLRLALDPQALAARSGEVEALVAHLERLPGIDWVAADRGEEIYVQHCERCHGRFGAPARDTTPPPADLSAPDLQRGVSDVGIATVVRRGHRPMPPVADLDDRDAKALVAFVRLLSPGFTLYTRYCASCHGEDGRADSAVDPGEAPRVIFDRRYFTTRDAEVLRRKVWHMLAEQRPRMPHLRSRVTEAETHAILDYLRRTAAREERHGAP
jgi:mono/diheme cytochrome c family protein